MKMRQIKGSVNDPMLARTFSGRLPAVRMFSQPKLDGVRCLATLSGLWSRSGRKITSCHHIEEQTAVFFRSHPDVILDGELFHSSLGFSTIISQVNRRRLGNTGDGAGNPKVQPHRFDSIDKVAPFAQRWAEVTSRILPFIKECSRLRPVPTDVVLSRAHLDALFARYLAAGHEGQMVRLDLPYECRRSAALLKRKLFEDDEFLIERVDAGSSAGRAYVKRVVLKTATGRRFAANVAGGQAVEEQLLTRSLHSATVKFKGLTSAQVPRFPIATAFHSLPRDL
jgi:DNA ligase-1